MPRTFRRQCFGQRQLRTTFTEGKGELVNSLKTGIFYSLLAPKMLVSLSLSFDLYSFLIAGIFLRKINS
jgi:hypothetical protein